MKGKFNITDEKQKVLINAIAKKAILATPRIFLVTKTETEYLRAYHQD